MTREENLEHQLRAAMTVIESFRPLTHAAKAIVEDGWPTLASNARLPASLEDRLLMLKEAYESIADMVADADAEANPAPYDMQAHGGGLGGGD